MLQKRAIDLSFAESGGLAPYKDGRIICRKGNEIYYTLATTDDDGDYIGYAKKRLERALRKPDMISCTRSTRKAGGHTGEGPE